MPKHTQSAPARSSYSISAKVSEKGAVSVYGLQRFPVTLYRDQWLAILDKADTLRAFMTQNAASLTEKAEGGPAKGTTAL